MVLIWDNWLMSRTDKDDPKARREHWMSVGTPSWFNRMQRKRERDKASQDLCKGREPQPNYGDLHYW
jgi:hypothetical protein